MIVKHWKNIGNFQNKKISNFFERKTQVKGVEFSMSLLDQNRNLRDDLCKVHRTLTGQVCTCNTGATLMTEYHRDIQWLVASIKEACGVVDREPSPLKSRGRSPDRTQKTRARSRSRSKSPVGRVARSAKPKGDDRDEAKSVYVYYDVSEKDVPEPFYSEKEKEDEKARLGQLFSPFGVIRDIKIWYYDHRDVGRKVPVAKVIFRFEDEKAKCLAAYNDILDKHDLRVQSSKF